MVVLIYVFPCNPVQRVYLGPIIVRPLPGLLSLNEALGSSLLVTFIRLIFYLAPSMCQNLQRYGEYDHELDGWAPCQESLESLGEGRHSGSVGN